MRTKDGMRAAVGALGAGFMAASVMAAPPKVLYSTIQTSPTSDVPGLTGLKFDNDASGFLRPYRSPNSKHWIMEAQLNVATTADDEVILVGNALTGLGTVVIRENNQAPWAPTGQLVGPIREKMQINNAANFAFGHNLAGTAPTTADEEIVSSIGGVLAAVATEGGAGPAGEAYGAVLHSAGITNDNRVAFVANSTVGALGTTQDDFVLLGGTIISQSGISGTPSGQLFTETWNLFDTDETYVNGDGDVVFSRGTLTGATTSNVALAVNNQIVLQESVIYAPLTAGVLTVSETLLTADGDWFARGETAGDVENFVIRNGTVIAITNQAVPGGLPGEIFDDAIFDACFFTMGSNALGDYFVGGVTNATDENANAVIVLNGEEVILRENDGVDVDGNGLADDDAFISVFNNEDTYIDNNKILFFTAELRNGAGAALTAQAFLRLPLSICAGDMNCDGVINFDDIDFFVAALTATGGWDEPPTGACYWRAGDTDGDLDADFDDIDGFVELLVTGTCS